MKEKQNQKVFSDSPKKMIMALIYPKKKHHTYMDQKTRNYLYYLERQIGLVDIMPTWEKTFLSVEYRFPLFWNPNCEGHAHIGKKGKQWIAQVSLVSNGIQYDIVRYLFSKLPVAEDVLIANTLNQVYAFYRSQNHNISEITCYECGEFFHWIDLQGTLEDKWVGFQECYCGCE